MCLYHSICVHLCSPLERAEKPFPLNFLESLTNNPKLSKFCPFPSICVQSSKQANNQPYELPWREGEAEKSCAALSVSVSTSICHLRICHLKALLLDEIKSMFNEIKDKKKYEVKSNCKKLHCT